MRIVEINTVDYGSTGKIMLQIAQCVRDSGYEAYTFSTPVFSLSGPQRRQSVTGHSYYGSFLENTIHFILGRLFARNGCFSLFSTARLIRAIKRIGPDLIHLHNLHTFCIHLPVLFHYLKQAGIPVVWTFHDCWPFTGQCPYFVLANCDKWRTGCHSCTMYRQYPKVRFDNSKRMYENKKRWFSGLENLTVVTPSQWLSELTQKSFMGGYPVWVIYNGIDLTVFKPSDSGFRKKYGCEHKKVLLGVAFNWGTRKGLDVFVELARRLGGEYQIVLVGTNETVDASLPGNIISIHRTQNQAELAEIYTAADLFLNPTREDNFPTVNIESLACGTPVVTFRTGGSPECLDESCGSVVDVDDVDAMEREVVRICTERPYSAEACIARAKQFDMNEKFKEYVKLYEDRTYCPERTV